ncbi:hypothetical protein PMAYCL1PPCAC_19416, partial [Pristionchus mayeri]
FSGAIPMFDKCDEKECHTFEESAPVKLSKITANPASATGTLGIDLDTSDLNKWIVTIARNGGEQCKFSIGGHEFPCWIGASQQQDVDGVTLTRLRDGVDDKGIKYEKYEIAAKNGDSVVDALQLYVQ